MAQAARSTTHLDKRTSQRNALSRSRNFFQTVAAITLSKANTDEPRKPAPAFDSWKEIVDGYMTQWTTHGQQAIVQGEYDRGIATCKSWREIGSALGQIVRGWERGC
jgi:hypothetical protein